jgi:hypothetical protein
MKNYLLIIIVLFSFISLNLKYELQPCENLELTSNRNEAIYENKVYCNLIVTDEARLKIFNNATIKVLNNFTVKRSAQLDIIDSKLEILAAVNILDKSQVSISNSIINSSKPIRIEGESKVSLNNVKLYSEELILGVKGMAKLDIIISEFIGNIIIFPYSYSKIFINRTSYFYIYLSNQQFDITINRSKFSLILEVTNKPSNYIMLPYGYYYHWNLTYITKEYIGIPGKINVYDSYIGIFRSNQIIVLVDSLFIANSKNITITVRDKLNVAHVRGGEITQYAFKIENVLVNLMESSIHAWNFEYHEGKRYLLANSSSVIIRSFSNSSILINNVDLIGVYSTDSSHIYIKESIINNYAISKLNSKIFITQTIIKNPSNFYAFDNSTIYIASLDNIPKPSIKISGETVQVLINVYGSVAVIASKNTTINLYILELGINTPNPKFVIIGKGITNKFGEILSYVGENLPNEVYILRLTLMVTDNTTLQVNRTFKIETPILVTPPSRPYIISHNATTSYVILRWEIPQQNPFIPVDSFQIYRGERRDNLKLIATVKDSFSYVDLNVIPGKTYYYAIKAYNYKGESEMSNIVFVEIPIKKEPYIEGLLQNWIASLAILSIIVVALSILVKSIKNKKLKR